MVFDPIPTVAVQPEHIDFAITRQQFADLADGIGVKLLPVSAVLLLVFNWRRYILFKISKIIQRTDGKHMKTKIKISNNEIKELLGAKSFDFPKYSTQILNLANQNAQGTRPAVVGQMSELIQEFSGKSIKEWEDWYLQKHPDAIQRAAEKIAGMVENFRDVMEKIDRQLIESWIRDLVIIKTFIGLKFQEAILSKAAHLLETDYRLASPEEESQGIDGFIGETPISIKPETYKAKKSLGEKIVAKFIYYEKAKDGISIDIANIVPVK